MTAYYNENNAYAAQWLRNLIADDQIAPGEVDERDIRDVKADELARFTQCHFFAGIGVWAYALRNAGWADDRPVWTGSCPCQPFSQAGQGKGEDDERHLWPVWRDLIAFGAPDAVFGEQVASKAGRAWFGAVSADLEDMGYAAAGFDLCSAGIGAPHIRQRLYFVGLGEGLADTNNVGSQGRADQTRLEPGSFERPERFRDAVGVFHPASVGSQGRLPGREGAQRPVLDRSAGRDHATGGLGLADSDGRETGRKAAEVARHRRADDAAGRANRAGPTRPTNGFWRDADWLGCRDGKFRPVEPGSFPLVDGSAFRLGQGGTDQGVFEGKSRTEMIRGYGNALNAELTCEFIAAVMEAAL